MRSEARLLLVFLLVAYGGAYAVDAVLLAAGAGGLAALPLLLARMGMVAVGVVAGAAAAGLDARALLERLGVHPGGFHWALVGSLVAASSCILAAVVSALLGLGEPRGPLSTAAASLGLPAWLLAALLVPVGVAAGLSVNALAALLEEVGWRGLLLELLEPRLGRLTPLVVGVAWGLWHAPLVAIMGYDFRGEGGVSALLVFTLYTVSLSLPLVWVKRRGGSLYPPSALHGTVNALGGLWDAFYTTRPWANLLAPPAGLTASASVLAVYAAARLAETVIARWRGGRGRG